jgi:hypothetical protein
MHVRFGEWKRSSASYSTVDLAGLPYVAFIIDAFARRIVGWWVPA